MSNPHLHNPHLHQHPTRNGQKFPHKVKFIINHQHGKKHKPPHRRIHVHPGNDGIMAMARSFQADNRRKRHEFDELCEVVVHGLGTFSVAFNEAMVKMINAFGSIHIGGGSGGGSHSSSSGSSLPWWDRKWQEYCDETFRQAQRDHHH